MKGYLRVYQGDNDLISKLYWGIVQDNYLNFYPDKKSRSPTSVINLDGCEVNTVYHDKYRTNLIEIKTLQDNSILLIPENIKEFNNWESILVQLSLANEDHAKSNNFQSMSRKFNNYNTNQFDEQPSQTLPNKTRQRISNISSPYNEDQYNDDELDSNVDNLENRQRYVKKSSALNRQVEPTMKPNLSAIEMSEYRRKSSDYNMPRPSTPPNEMKRYPNSKVPRDSNISNQRNMRNIETVKEDPMMNDNDVLQTKTIEELRRKYPISDKTKRWSIAATDIIGKSNDELFIMLIQLNREKSHMDIWKDTLEKQIMKIDAQLNETDDYDKEELESSREYLVEQLNEMNYMVNLAHPLVSFLESVVQMSDMYRGDNQTFHVVYHQHPANGKEDFSNLNFIRHNQEREVARLINENSNQSQIPSLHLNSLKNSMRSNSHYGKENDPEIGLDLKKSQKFIDRRNELNEVLEDINNQLKNLDPLKTSVETFLAISNDSETNETYNSAPTSNKSSVKSMKTQKPTEIKMNDLAMMPRRSTRKSPKSDMTPSLNRSANTSRQNTLTRQSLNRDIIYGNNSVNYNRRRSNSSNRADREVFNIQNGINTSQSSPLKHSRSTNSLKDPNLKRNSNQSYNQKNYNTESRLQNQLRDLVNADSPLTFAKRKSPITPDISDLPDGPLIKLDVSKYHNVHRPVRLSTTPNMNHDTDLRNSISNSDISTASAPRKQRMNLNEYVDDKKIWKNPGRIQKSPRVSDNNLSHNDIDARIKADHLIDCLLSSPSKVDIKDRYRGSISNESDIDQQRNERIRKQVTKESMASYTEAEVGQRQERESMLLKTSILAQEASRRSRKL